MRRWSSTTTWFWPATTRSRWSACPRADLTSSTSTRRSTPAAPRRGARWPPAEDPRGHAGWLRRPALPHAAAAVTQLRRRLRRLPGLSRAPADPGPRAPGPARHALLPHRLPRGALLQAPAGRDLRSGRRSSTSSSGPMTTGPSRAAAGPPSTTRSSPTCARPALTTSMPRRSTASPTWPRAWSAPRRQRAGKRPTDVWFHTIVPDQRPREDRLSDPEARGCPAAPGGRLLASRGAGAWIRSPARARWERCAASWGGGSCS